MSLSSKNICSEFIGTFLLVFTVGCNVLGGGGIHSALSIASVLMVMVYALGSVSGAHFNPAVSFAFYLSKADLGFDVWSLVGYAMTQLLAGACAGFSCKALFGDSIAVGPQIAVDPMTSEPGESYGWASALLCEALYTFVLAFVVLRTAVFKPQGAEKTEYFGLCIGFVIVAGGYAAGPISGGCFNPAVAFGLDVSSADIATSWVWYSLAECFGAACAVLAHFAVGNAPSKQYSQLFLSEFLGTFVLVLTVGLNVLTMSPAGALSIGASLMVMVYSLGNVSGAHFNPAVTLAIALHTGIFADVGLYVLAQLVGAACAGAVYTGVTGLAFPLAPGANYSWMDAAVAEAVATFVLCFVVLNVAVVKQQQQVYGLAIGFCIVSMGNAIGMVSGGSLNPAVSFGIDTSYAMKGGTWMNCLAYSGFEIVGAALAAGATRLVRFK